MWLILNCPGTHEAKCVLSKEDNIKYRDKDYDEITCIVLKEKNSSMEGIKEWRRSGVDDDYITT